MSRFDVLRIFVIAGIAGACGSSSSEPAAGEPSQSRPQTEYDQNGCEVPSGKLEEGSLCVTSLTAAVKDLDGNAIPDLVTTACGSGCTYGKTDATGTTRMQVRRYMYKPALMLHGRSRWATLYSRFDAAGDIDRGTIFLPIMPFAEGVVLPEEGAAGTVSFRDVTFSFAAGTEIKIERLELQEPDEQKFRAISVPLDKAPPFVTAAGGNFAAIYAMTPFATRIKPGAAVTIANTAKLPAGAAVDLFQQATMLDDSNGPYGGFSKVAEAHVSADGATIATDEGQLVTEITWLGVRARTPQN
jgi:hypothetical protein